MAPKKNLNEPSAAQLKKDIKKIEASFEDETVEDGKHVYVGVDGDDTKVRKYEYNDSKWEFISIMNAEDVSDDSDDESDDPDHDSDEESETEEPEPAKTVVKPKKAAEKTEKPKPVKKQEKAVKKAASEDDASTSTGDSKKTKKKRVTMTDIGAKLVPFVDDEIDNMDKDDIKEWMLAFVKEFGLRKKKRAQSPYQLFLSQQLLSMKDVPSKERMALASGRWKEHKAKMEAEAAAKA